MTHGGCSVSSLTAVYQPVVHLDTGMVTYHESLIRHARGASEHLNVIQFSEEYGLIGMLDLHVLGETIVKLRQAKSDVSIGVNISGYTLENSLNNLLSVLFKNRDIAHRLVFEITETYKVNHQDVVAEFASALRLAGAKLAIDDLWSGHATFDQVQKIRPDYVKTASQVMQDLIEAESHRWMRTLVSEVRKLGGEIIVEHVDAKAKLDILKKLGIKYGQGFYLGKPQNLELN